MNLILHFFEVILPKEQAPSYYDKPSRILMLLPSPMRGQRMPGCTQMGEKIMAYERVCHPPNNNFTFYFYFLGRAQIAKTNCKKGTKVQPPREIQQQLDPNPHYALRPITFT